MTYKATVYKWHTFANLFMTRYDSCVYCNLWHMLGLLGDTENTITILYSNPACCYMTAVLKQRFNNRQITLGGQAEKYSIVKYVYGMQP